jgi:predicted TIM-barrel fold metal-dependent hydrolase
MEAANVRNSTVQDKMLFSQDWPVIAPDRWMADFRQARYPRRARAREC